MIAILDNVLNGTNGANGVNVTRFVTVVTEKEQDHAPVLEIAWAKVQIRTRVTRRHALIGHHGDRGVIVVPLVVRESDPKIANVKEKAIAMEPKVKLKSVKLVSFVFLIQFDSV